MSNAKKYPEDCDIKVQWTGVHIAIFGISFLVWPAFFLISTVHSLPRFLSLAGLQLGTIGVVLSSLKTPPYGQFHDGGALEFKRANVEGPFFQRGMWLIAIGFLLQAGAAL
jgi:hypothetical protein